MPLSREGRAEWRRRNRARRVEIDGRLVAAHLPDERHGRESTWTDHGCQCEPCWTNHTNRSNESSRKRGSYWRDRRVLIGGRLVSRDAKSHGTKSAYSHYGCRCAPCTEAQARAAQKWRSKR